MTYKQYNYDSFKILTIKSNQFKGAHIEINFVEDIKNVNVPLRSFLTDLLSYTTKKYPTKRELLIALEEMYNSDYHSYSTRIGQTYISSFNYDFVSPKYINDKNYLENNIQFLCEQILNPNINDNKFDERSIEIIKEIKHSSIDHYKENPLTFAQKESKNILFKDSYTSILLSGNHQDIDNITNKDLVNDYQKMFQDASVDVLIIGDLDMDFAVSCFAKYLEKQAIVEKKYNNLVDNKIKPYKEIEVESEYVQTQIICYLQYDEINDFEKYAVAPIYMNILGNANQSDKLTTYLRVENPLVYRCGALYMPNDKYIMIGASLSYKNIQPVKKAIQKALKEMEKGIIDEDYLELQKTKNISDIKIQQDNPSYLLDNYYFNVLYNSPTANEVKELVKKVTIDDIKKFAKKLKLTMTYILKEDSNE